MGLAVDPAKPRFHTGFVLPTLIGLVFRGRPLRFAMARVGDCRYRSKMLMTSAREVGAPCDREPEEGRAGWSFSCRGELAGRSLGKGTLTPRHFRALTKPMRCDSRRGFEVGQ